MMYCSKLSRKQILVVIALFFNIMLWAQSTSLRDDELKFRHYTINDGLSHTSISDINQDHKGFIWIGTKHGLNRFDGIKFKNYLHDDSNSLSILNHRINDLCVDSKGNVWVGTFKGLSLYKGNDMFENFQPDKFNIVLAISEDDKHNLWVATDKGLRYFDTKIKKFVKNDVIKKNSHILEYQYIDKVFYDSKKNLWAITYKGVYKLSSGSYKFQEFPFDTYEIGELKKGRSYDIAEDHEGNIWIGAHNELWHFNKKQTRLEPFFLIKNGILTKFNAEIRTIYTDASGYLWLGTYSGLFIVDSKKGTYSKYIHKNDNPYSLSSNSIYKIFKDNSDNLWIGTWQGAVNYLEENFHSFRHYSSISGLSYNVVSSFAEDDRHNYWIGTEGGGLNFYDSKSKAFKIFKNNITNRNSLANDNVQDLELDKNGKLYIATHGSGLDVYDTKKNNYFQHFRSDKNNQETLSSDWILTLKKDSQGRIWVGTIRAGLNLLNPKTQKIIRFKYSNNLNHTIHTIFEDRQQRIWVGTERGIGLVDMSSFSVNRDVVQIINSKIKSAVNCIYQDANNDYWIATEEQGLFYLKSDFTQVKHFDVKEGLPDNTVVGILPDKKGNLWLSTFKGLSKFNTKSHQFENYDVLDGLQSNEFNYDAYYAASNGELLFGGVNGFNVLNPEKIKKNVYVPPVVITDIKVNGKSVHVLNRDNENLQEVILDHNQFPLSIDFTALNFTQSQKNRYKYILEGKDDQWQDIGNKRSLTFVDINPGKYILKIKGANNNGLWNDNAEAIMITVLSPWWKTWEAYVCYFLIGLLLLFWLDKFLKFRRAEKDELKVEKMEKVKIQEMSQLKLQFFTNISHELRTPLTLILGSLEELTKKRNNTSEEQKNHLKVLDKNAKSLLRKINELMDFRKHEVEKLKLNAAEGNIIIFLKETRLSFQEMATYRDIKYNFKNDREKINVYFDRDKMEMIIFNLLSNAFKFTSDKGKISVETKVIEDEQGEPIHFQFSVKDNGVGIPKEQASLIFDEFYQVEPDVKYNEIKGSGIGLSLVKSLVDLHHGSIAVDTEVGKGTEFIVTIPIGRAHLDDDEIITKLKNGDDISSYDVSQKKKKLEEKNLEKDKVATVLVVEDNAEIRNFIITCLQDHYSVLEASDGAEGLEIATHKIPDLIVSDIMMPEIDGIELCGKLKKDLRTSHIPIILLTARTSVIFKNSAFETGADAYIHKPFTVSNLQLRIKNLIEARKKQQEYFIRNYKVSPESISLTSKDDDFLRKAINIVEANISNSEFTTDSFAKDIGMSRTALYQKLKGLIGQSPTEFVRTIRVKRAAQLFLQNKYTITEVIYIVGFNDLKYFRTCFRQQFQMSPSEYVAANKI